ncbi:unnamed protein product [Bemisia tabaci]|uniref:Uncharacterized protein n=2 Tax=Bemisia tabaci TaxID=7038 RepID=A0A9P0CCI9_BEMTA|nr:unnamed protein product [Bemisia tabaci]
MKEVKIRILNEQLNEKNSLYENLLGENGVLKKEKMNYQKEVTLIYAMDIIEKFESQYGREYNATGTVRRGDNLRRAKWTFIFKNRRNETAIKHIINEINADGTNEEKIIDGIVKIAEVVSEREKKFVKEIVETGTYLIAQKHKLIIQRNLNMPMIFFGDVPEFVVKTATVLEKAYVEYIVTKISGTSDGNDE